MISYRDRLRLFGGLTAYAGLRAAGIPISCGLVPSALAQNVKGGTLNWMISPDPSTLTTAFSSAISVQQISSKMLEGLLAYDANFKPMPSLATKWEVSPDGLTISFNLREGVKWHDGKPFTSADVKFTFEEILKQYHPRGRATFANLKTVETPDNLTAIIKMSKPAPYIMICLAASESPILPKHIFEGTEPIKNPHTNAPIGTGPFKYVDWERGQHITLERNPAYWAKDKPALDRIIVPNIPDIGARAVALETGEVHLGGADPVAMRDLNRLDALPDLAVTTHGYSMFGAMFYFEFNMRDPQFKDVRVRQAIAHGIDKDFVAKNIWFGYAKPANSPISQKLTNFHTDNVPTYPYDPKKAEELLDAAGFTRKDNGIRFRITHDPSITSEQYRRFGAYFKQAMRQIGIDVHIRAADAATWQRRIWTDNDFQTSCYGIFNMADPTIGVQRIFWSKNIKKGVPYSNGSGYNSAEMDNVLESAQVELDAKKRRELFAKMQRLAMTDLPIIPIVSRNHTTVYNQRVRNLENDFEGVFGTFSELAITSS